MSKILIADDDSGIADVTSIVLQQAGYEVAIATDIHSTLSFINNDIPLVLLLDVWLAGGSGVHLTQQLKSNKKTRNMPVILISANNNLEKMAAEAGADEFLAKPFDIDDLVSLVNKYKKKKK